MSFVGFMLQAQNILEAEQRKLISFESSLFMVVSTLKSLNKSSARRHFEKKILSVDLFHLLSEDMK